MRLQDISRRDTIILILVTCFFGFLYASFDDPLYDVDQIGYVQGARNILHGRGYLVDAQATFQNREEVQLYPVYRDPVHDFGIYHYDPAKLKFIQPAELPLYPIGAEIGSIEGG